jgi:hypothetical protein
MAHQTIDWLTLIFAAVTAVGSVWRIYQNGRMTPSIGWRK